MLSTIQNTSKYTAKILNISQNRDISDFIDRLDVDLPKAREISSLNAKFVLDEKLINDGNEIEIQVLDEVGNNIYSFTGKATLDSTVYPYTNNDKFSYVIKDSYSKLFEKIILETKVYYDLYFCNNQDKSNSLLHIVANKLRFTDLVFEDMKFENGKCMRVPFVIFREIERWIDELQTLISATNSILYVHNKKLYFRACNLALNKTLKFDKTNIITNIEKRFKPNHSNGIKVLYDRYQKLDNQVVFNLKSKEIINPNTPVGANVKAARINYITSSVSNPVITKASGYYFTSNSTKSLVRVDLKEGTHYTLEEFTETQAIVKFFNPYNYTLYVDNFEIKGIPLVMYKDNNAIVKNPNIVDKNQENFEVIPKNKYVQTLEMAKNIAKLEYANRIESKYSYTFDTVFLPNVQLGEIYELEIKDIKCKVRVNSFSIHLKPSNFRMKLHCDEVSEVGTCKTGNTDSLTPATQFIDLSNLEKAIDENKVKLEATKEDIAITNQKMNSVLHKGEVAPTENIKEYDCWLNPKNNQWKQYLNGKWSPVAEKDLTQAMKHFNSLEEAKLSLGRLGNRIGGFLINDGEKLGAINGVVAESSIDKKGTVTLKNVNSLLAFNVQNPANPNDIKSKFFMGVSNVNTVPSNIVFKIGEAEVTGSTIEMEDSGKINIKVGKKELSEKLSEVDKNIVNTAKNINDNKKILEEKINSSKYEAKKYTDSAKNDLNSKMTEAEEKAYYLSLMANGKMLYDDPEFREGGNSTKTYSRSNEVTTHVIKIGTDDSDYPPNNTGKVLRMHVNTKTYSDIGHGGFYFATPSRKEAVFITKIIAKIPVGCAIDFGTNAIGTYTNAPNKWLTSQEGTGKYETYLCYVKCGDSGNFSSTNFFYLTGKQGELFSWYVAYATVFDCTAADYSAKELDKKIDTTKKEVVSHTNASVTEAKKSINASVGVIKDNLTGEINKTNAEIAKGEQVYTFEVGGEADKYYPVWFYNDINTMDKKVSTLNIYRTYYEKAPSTWNTATHKGSLDLQIQTNLCGSWSGRYALPVVTEFHEDYATQVAKIERVKANGIFVWLRGGGAVYHYFSDLPTVNKELRHTLYMNGLNGCPTGSSGSYTENLSYGTYEELGSAQSIKDIFIKQNIADLKEEVVTKFTNADGRLTNLQSNYEDTVKDISSFKTSTSDKIDTVQGALGNGDFKITANTVFDGSTRFVSRGTNEVITIQNGAIDFHRDGQRLTRTKNIRHGTISTDSKGKGIVNFEGFKQPMQLFLSIKSVNFGKNMASEFCYAEHIEDCKYRFYVGGTTEVIKEPKPVKIMGTTWSANNVVQSELLGYGGILRKIYVRKKEYKEQVKKHHTTKFPKWWGGKGSPFRPFKNYTLLKHGVYRYLIVNKVPKIKVEIFRMDINGNTLLASKTYEMTYEVSVASNLLEDSTIHCTLHNIDFRQQINSFKKYKSRANIKYALKITILEKDFDIQAQFCGTHYTDGHIYVGFKGVVKTITKADITNTFITASAETSTISSATGYGEVSYIAMEVD